MLVNAVYYNPQDDTIIFIENNQYWLINREGNTTPSSDYYPNSQHWNGESPFVKVNYLSSKLHIFNHIEVYMIKLVHESNGCLLNYLYYKLGKKTDYLKLMKYDISEIKKLITLIEDEYEKLY